MKGRPLPRVARLTLLAATVVGAVTLSLASAAMATPPKILLPFVQCPAKTAGVELCLNAQTTSGGLTVGKTTVPITKTITLQGGALPIGDEQYVLLPAKDGNTLSKTALNVPGGLLGLVNCTEIGGAGLFEKLERGTCKAIFENGTTGVTATTEVAASVHNPATLNLGALLAQSGTAITLPVRVHLKNPLLGEGCFIGSEANPITLHLTDGTTAPPLPNKPISGSFGTFVGEEEGELAVAAFVGQSIVDNSFSAPVAEGCGRLAAFLIDPIINAKIGLPSAAGHNTAILTGTTRVAAAEEVAAHE
jgi:hypothetical protein